MITYHMTCLTFVSLWRYSCNCFSWWMRHFFKIYTRTSSLFQWIGCTKFPQLIACTDQIRVAENNVGPTQGIAVEFGAYSALQLLITFKYSTYITGRATTTIFTKEAVRTPYFTAINSSTVIEVVLLSATSVQWAAHIVYFINIQT